MAPTAEQLTKFLEKRGFAGVRVVMEFPGYTIQVPRMEYEEPLLDLLSTIEEPGPFNIWVHPLPWWQVGRRLATLLPWRIRVERKRHG